MGRELPGPGGRTPIRTLRLMADWEKTGRTWGSPRDCLTSPVSSIETLCPYPPAWTIARNAVEDDTIIACR